MDWTSFKILVIGRFCPIDAFQFSESFFTAWPPTITGMAYWSLIFWIIRLADKIFSSAFDNQIISGQSTEQGVIQEWIAKSRIKIEEARLLTLKTAWLIDTYSKEEAKIEISSIKVTVVEAASYVIDKAIQAHGAMGLSQDTPLARMAAGARVLRIADGPDEVHLRSIARREMNKYKWMKK